MICSYIQGVDEELDQLHARITREYLLTPRTNCGLDRDDNKATPSTGFFYGFECLVDLTTSLPVPSEDVGSVRWNLDEGDVQKLRF